MNGVIRRLAGASLVYGFGGMASRMISFLLLPLFTSYLAPVDYGVIAMLSIMVNLLLGPVTLGTGNSMGICFHEAKTSDERSTVVWSTSITIAISASIWVSIGIMFSAPISNLLLGSPEHATAVSLAFGQLAASALVVPLLGRWRLEERAKTFIVATLLFTIVAASANVYAVVVLRRGLLGMLWSTFIVQCMYCVILYFVAWLSYRPSLSRETMRRVVAIGWPSIFGVGAFFLLDFGGRLALSRLENLDALGVYSVGLTLGMGMAIFAEGAFGAAWPAFFLSYQNKTEEASQVFGRVLQIYLVLFLTLAVAFFLLAKPLVTLMAAEPFHGASQVVGLIALCSVVKGAYLIFLPGLYYHRKLHIQTSLEWLGALVGLGACLSLVPIAGMFGAALGTLCGYLVLAVATAIVTRKYLRVDVSMGFLGSLLAMFVSMAALSYVDFGTGVVWDWIVRGALFLVFAAVVSLLFAPGILRTVRHSFVSRIES